MTSDPSTRLQSARRAKHESKCLPSPPPAALSRPGLPSAPDGRPRACARPRQRAQGTGACGSRSISARLHADSGTAHALKPRNARARCLPCKNSVRMSEGRRRGPCCSSPDERAGASRALKRAEQVGARAGARPPNPAAGNRRQEAPIYSKYTQFYSQGSPFSAKRRRFAAGPLHSKATFQ